MYYRIFDEESVSFIPTVYNSESKSDIKKEIESLLREDLSHDDVSDVVGLKWDQFVVKLKDFGFTVEQQPTPFPVEDNQSAAWEDYNDRYDEADRYGEADDSW